jgi:hypothetical protein
MGRCGKCEVKNIATDNDVHPIILYSVYTVKPVLDERG